MPRRYEGHKSGDSEGNGGGKAGVSDGAMRPWVPLGHAGILPESYQRNGAMQLKERLLKAEDLLEFEQMNFQKQTEELTKRKTEETAKLVELERKRLLWKKRLHLKTPS